ncbi:AEC family transporter [Algoriphagus aquimarinus]|uniref:AEC family transporter n=1 Tax=Algoriphagus aquimarinus TaxID=237018 RepID=A0A5C7B172_9BACT|nr:AEC family transporter [Algoriphagus aquimarinus]TXE14491.1 AEC family transporter [Algoriphagus aquimarinus]|tara:strand:- start:3984 stop:4892 length:909 start_codon:yes stop_codon:yes gene_type:complete
MTGAFIAFLCLLLGLFLQKQSNLPLEKITKWVNAYLLNIVLPALALLYIPQIEPSWGLLLPISSAWFTFLLSWLIFGVLGKLLKWDNQTTGCLVIVAGLANTSFMGFPVIEGLYGKEGLPIALLIDQGGSFLLVSSLAILVGSIYSHQEGNLSEIPLKILRFPPFGFLLVTIAMSILGWKTPEFLIPLVSLLGKTMAPVAIFAIGLKFSLDFDSLSSKFYWFGMGYRLLLAPLMVWLIYRNFLPQNSLELKVSVLESGMAPMITGSIVAIQYDLKPKLATLLAGLGIPISIVTIMIWYYFLS